MKGLIITFIIGALLIDAGMAASIIIAQDFSNKLATAHESGFEEGYAQGYVEGFHEGSRVGFQEGSKSGYAMVNRGDDDSSNEAGFYFVYNPAYDELRQILARSEASSAVEIHDCAEANGIRVAYFRCQIARKAAKGRVWVYQLVAFETVDKGLIIIEPWSHREVKVEVGQRYSELNGRPPRVHDDTITKLTIVW